MTFDELVAALKNMNEKVDFGTLEVLYYGYFVLL